MPGLTIQGGALRRVLVEAWESFNGLRMVSNNPTASPAEYRDAVIPTTQNINPALFSTVSGGAGAVAYDAGVGRHVHTWASAAGANTLGGSAIQLGHFPFGRRFALPGSLPLDWIPRPVRYRLDCVVRVTVAGPAQVALGASANGNFLNAAPNNPGIAWASRPGVNGGAWMPRWRAVDGGGIADGPDTGTVAADWHRLSIMLEEGAVPRLVWLLDDAPVFELAGDANQPDALAGFFPSPIFKSLGPGAGTTTQWAESRFLVEEL